MREFPVIIDFEGIDYSFKETNSKALETYLNTIEGIKAKRYSFPSYGEKSGYIVEGYLKGKYSDFDENLAIYLFLSDMMSRFYNEIIPDINYKDLDVVIFDRFWYSNVYYTKDSMMIDTYEKVAKLAKGFGLPHANLIISMGPFQSSDLKSYYENMNKRENKDIYESNTDFLLKVFDNLKNFNILTEKFVKTIILKEINISKEEVPRPRENIFNDIISIMNEIHIKEVVESCRLHNTQLPQY